MHTFIEIPEQASWGETIGIRFAVLEHETGLEIFLKVGELISQNLVQAAIVSKVLDKVYEKVGEKALDKLLSFLMNEWDRVTTFKIEFVEIRT